MRTLIIRLHGSDIAVDGPVMVPIGASWGDDAFRSVDLLTALNMPESIPEWITVTDMGGLTYTFPAADIITVITRKET